MTSTPSEGAGETVAGDHVVRTYPLNSRRLTAEILSRIAKGLGLPTNASLAETRQMIEGRLAEDYDPKNVEVSVIELAPGVTTIELRGEDGLIVEISADEGARLGQEPSGESPINEGEGGAGAREDSASREEELRAELELARDRAHELEAELERVQESNAHSMELLTEEVSKLNTKVREEKEKYTTL